MELAFRAGTTVRLAPDVVLSSDIFTAVGAGADSVRFIPLYDPVQYPDSTWGGLLITGNGSRIARAVFEGAETAVEVRGEDVRIENSRFENNTIAVLTGYRSGGQGIDPRSELVFNGNRVSGTGATALALLHADVEMLSNDISHNTGQGILIEDADIWPFAQNVVESNGDGFAQLSGITVLNGGVLEMTYWSGDSGYNLVFENAVHETSVFMGGVLHIGNASNTIYKNGLPGFGARYVYNDSGVKVNALATWWGSASGPPARSFYGSVNYVPYLPCDPEICRAAGNRRSGLHTVGQVERVQESGEERSEAWKAWALGEIQSTRNVLMAAPESEHAPALVRYLAAVQGLDRGNVLGEEVATLNSLHTLQGYLRGDYSTPLRETAAAALVAEVRHFLRSGDVEEAQRLVATHGSAAHEYGTREERVALGMSRVTLHEANGRYTEALASLDDVTAMLDVENDRQLLDALTFIGGLIERRVEPSEPRQMASGYVTGNVPARFSLAPVYPNPFNPQATVPFELPAAANVTLTVYDVLGRRVAVLADRLYQAGRHEVVLDGSRLASGTYLVRAVMDSETGEARTFTRRVTLLK